MSGLEGALCRGKHELFDSTWEPDHREAAELCAQCPAIGACGELLVESSQKAYGGGKGGYIQGTWAGQLFGQVGKPRPVVSPIEAACELHEVSKTTEWENVSGAGSTLATSPGTSTRAQPVRGSASRGL